jgi:hypothetical protein
MDFSWDFVVLGLTFGLECLKKELVFIWLRQVIYLSGCACVFLDLYFGTKVVIYLGFHVVFLH